MTDDFERKKKAIEFNVSPRYIFKPFADPDYILDVMTGQKLLKEDVQTSVLIYKNRVEEYFFRQARKLLTDSTSAYTVIMIAASQIEGLQQYVEGKTSEGNSAKVFTRGLKRIFPDLEIPSLHQSNPDKIYKEFYNVLRCGLFHDGFTRGLVYVCLDFEDPKHQQALRLDEWEYNRDKFRFWINPKLFLNEIEKDFNDYVKKLQDQSNDFNNDRENFKIFWEANWSKSKELRTLAEAGETGFQV
ncbi:MAG: hypothetical protein KME47_01980 [Nodosilinea sp. WJT8-NPBG4]|jgi:hypothetical protein|nr:hypothetical protein [Nodosilinea sp. WJT8-NPBG4]